MLLTMSDQRGARMAISYSVGDTSRTAAVATGASAGRGVKKSTRCCGLSTSSDSISAVCPQSRCSFSRRANESSRKSMMTFFTGKKRGSTSAFSKMRPSVPS
jgi:hypothetical protein